MKYRTFKLKKKSGGMRKISAPDADLKKYQRKALRKLERDYHKMLKNSSIQNVAHGFLTGRNVITAAQQHVGYKATIMMDLTEFFDTVHISMFEEAHQDKYFFNKEGFCGQGFVTSPMLSNIAFINPLLYIKQHLDEFEPDHVFTMYADDLQISLQTEDKDRLKAIIKVVEDASSAHGFTVNAKKTRIKYAKFGWRRILGVNVGVDSIRATRKIMRKIRAADHQHNGSSKGGLINWSNCNLPNQKDRR